MNYIWGFKNFKLENLGKIFLLIFEIFQPEHKEEISKE